MKDRGGGLMYMHDGITVGGSRAFEFVFYFSNIYLRDDGETSSVFTPRGQSLRYGALRARHTNSGSDFNETPGCTICLLGTHKNRQRCIERGNYVSPFPFSLCSIREIKFIRRYLPIFYFSLLKRRKKR